MKINYDIQKIDALLHDIAAITGLTLGFWDDKMNLLVVQPPKQNPFCYAIRCTAEGRQRCATSDHKMLTECIVNHGPATHTCHAGIPDSAVPLYYDDRLLGFISFGQLTDSLRPFGEVWQRVKDLGIPEKKMREAYNALPHYSRDHIRATTTIAKACVEYTLLEKMISISNTTQAEDIAAYIDEHLAENITFTDIMSRFHLSKSTLYDLFHRSFKTTVHAYIQAKRLECAAVALAESEEPVAGIGTRVGINDQNYFSRIFKKTYGMPPLAYRRAHFSVTPKATPTEKSLHPSIRNRPEQQKKDNKKTTG